jgi:hypothetical protein
MDSLDTDDEESFVLWQQQLQVKKAIYEAYPEHIKRAIRELEVFYYPMYNRKEPLSKIKDIFINARKMDYPNKNLDFDTNISDEDFKIAIEHWDIKSFTKNNKIYFKCIISPSAKKVLNTKPELFVFIDETHEYNNKNYIDCEICYHMYDKNKVCAKSSTKKHMYREWCKSHNLTISFYEWEKKYYVM